MATGAVIAVVAIGTAIQMEASKKAARAKARALGREGDIKNQQAIDLIERFEINSDELRKFGKQFKGDQVSSFIKGGVLGTEGSPLLALEQTNRAIQRTIDLERMEVDAQVLSLREGASLDQVLAGDVRSEERLQRAGIFFSGVGRAAGGASRSF